MIFKIQPLELRLDLSMKYKLHIQIQIQILQMYDTKETKPVTFFTTIFWTIT